MQKVLVALLARLHEDDFADLRASAANLAREDPFMHSPHHDRAEAGINRAEA